MMIERIKNTMNTNKNTNKKLTENAQILANYHAWLRSHEPAIDTLNNTLLPQEQSNPYKRCYNGHDKIRRQLPKYWFIREDKTLITFKKGHKILTVPHVVHTNKCMDRPCYAISIKTENGYTTKQIADYTLVTLVWNPQAIYGNARKLLEESLIDNLGKRDGERDKAHGHHADGRDSDLIIIADTHAHDFCHHSPATEEPMTEEQTRKFSHDLGQISDQEPNKFTFFYKGKGAEQGLLQADKKITITGKALFDTKYALSDKDGNTVAIGNLASILEVMGFRFTITPAELKID